MTDPTATAQPGRQDRVTDSAAGRFRDLLIGPGHPYGDGSYCACPSCSYPTKENKPVPAGRFRKKPVEIDAGQYDGTYASVAAWLGSLGYDPEDGDGSDGVPNMYEADDGLVIETLEGDMRADPGDWIIRGIKGEFYPVKPDIFAETYEAVDG